MRAQALALGHRLRALQAQPNELIAVVMHKGWEQVCATMGVLYAGAAYLSLDPMLPQQRIDYILQQARVRTVLTQSWVD